MHHSSMDHGPNNMSQGHIDMGGMDDSRDQYMPYQVKSSSNCELTMNLNII